MRSGGPKSSGLRARERARRAVLPVRAALQALESHVSHVARLVRDAMLAAVADPDLEERVALAFRRRAAGDVRGR